MREIINISDIKNEKEIIKLIYSDWLSINDSFPLELIRTIKNTSKLEDMWSNISQLKDVTSYISHLDAALINKKLYKINGIIRKGLWEKGVLEKPKTVIIHVCLLEMDDYQKLINILYPLSPRNRSQNIVLACYKNNGLKLSSDRLRHGYISDALNITLRGNPVALQDKRTLNQEVNIALAIQTFKKELILLDSINPDTNIFFTGVLAAALLMVSIDERNLAFFVKLNQSQGVTKGEAHDPVEALLRAMDLIKKRHGAEGKIQVELCSKTVRAISAWRLGEDDPKYWIKRLASIVFLPEIRVMKRIKGILGVKTL